MARTGTKRTEPPRKVDVIELPIDGALPEILKRAGEPDCRALIIEAEPGAGKTTRLPPSLLNLDCCEGHVLVSEPRRIAARLSALRVSLERDCTLGTEVGYRVRFDNRTSKTTRLHYLTEGLLLRELLEDPLLTGTSFVVLDEAHERAADLDVLLALVKRTMDLRADLKLVVMSATLDREQWKAYLPEASYFHCTGRSFHVERHYQKSSDERSLSIQVRGAVRAALAHEGDILVFLPGAREIRQCQDALTDQVDADLFPLHGDLPVDKQLAAVSSHEGRPRVILSTNVAESSVTIAGVTTVIDTGLCRQKVFDPFSGVGRLETVPASRARLEQRAGRAGRVRDGRVFRLFTRGQFESRHAQDPPELLREDLSGILLMLKNAGLDWQELKWLTPPKASAWEKAEALLAQLGALSGDTPHNARALSEIGQAMARLPLAPRFARLVVEAQRRGISRQGCLAAALLSERDILRPRSRSNGGQSHVTKTDSDLADRIELFEQIAESGFSRSLARELEIDLPTLRQVDRVQKSLVSAVKSLAFAVSRPQSDEDALNACLLRAFPDWVAKTQGGSKKLLLASGVQAQLSEESGVLETPLILALCCDAPRGIREKSVVRIAVRITADWLVGEASDVIEADENLRYNAEKDRVEEVSTLRYQKLVLDEEVREATPSESSQQLLVKTALSKGPTAYDPLGHLDALFVRLKLLATHHPHLVEKLLSRPWDSDTNQLLTRRALAFATSGVTRLSALQEADLAEWLLSGFSGEEQRLIAHLVPRTVTLRGGRKLDVHYEEGKPPWISSRLQDFFSMVTTPSLCEGKVPLQVHLLAPNHRAVQVTSDLGGFWINHYPDLRRQLSRRYPRHLWPEDGRTALPPQPGRIK